MLRPGIGNGSRGLTNDRRFPINGYAVAGRAAGAASRAGDPIGSVSLTAVDIENGCC